MFKYFRQALQALRLVGAPVEDWKSQAQNLRETARTYGLVNHFPVMLNEPERCTCRKLTLVLMQPHNICGECWLARLDVTIKRDLK